MKNWFRRHWKHLLIVIVALAVVAGAIGGIMSKIDQLQAELRQAQEENAQLWEEKTQCEKENAQLRDEITELSTAPNISVEKWVRVDGDCAWQKEISAEKGDWISVRIVVNVTRTINNVWVRDAALATSGPWAAVQDLKVDGVPFVGNIAQGISLGKLTDKSREITFRAQLSKSTYRYFCGENILENIAEAGDCGFQATASARIIVNIKCVSPPPSCCEPAEPEIRPPTVITR